ncbi:hypothetical protein OZX62_03415 [Bifidobacterium sp. ESL0690]|uniref:hypothetical protein n=1 Tax=Bifidobacterium sp. ESL0690 TaxID=2983214 RepID=UPI0023F81C0B|nr:hypothetical protein [Bifidobacterium sp. ESL0690]WEV47335.1 hypothetical protein OZX62_03415 [Bifidobacterium sp. ESL0690]
MPTPSHRFNPKSWSLNQIRKAQFVCMLLATLVSLPSVFFPDTWIWQHFLCMVGFIVLTGIDVAFNKLISRGPNGMFTMGLNDSAENRLKDESALLHENQANTMSIFILFLVLICIAMINQFVLNNWLRFNVYLLLFLVSLMETLQLGCYLCLERRDLKAADAKA